VADLAHASENDTDLFGDQDATHWAQRFTHVRNRRLAADGLDIAGDEDTMLTWFAGAIETGKMLPVTDRSKNATRESPWTP
jgi:hypothetical protein